MVYPDWMLVAWAQGGGVDPFDVACINPASIDLRLDCQFVNLLTGERFESECVEIHPGDAILASTLEIVTMPPNAIGTIYVKSSLARQGLDHSLAGLCDPGFSGTITLELHTHRSIKLQAGQRIVQLKIDECCHPPMKTYEGKYQGQRGPTKAR